MPKYRKLPLSVIDSLDIAEMPDDFTRLTWLLLPLIVCSEGRAVDNAQWLASKLYPAREDVDASMIADAMNWFAHRDMIRRYNVNGRHYFYLTNFHKHQGDTSREAESPYPAPPEEVAYRPVMTGSRVGQELVPTGSRSKQSNSNYNSKGSSNAAAKQGANAQETEIAAAAAFLKQFGIAYNDTTAPIAGMDAEYIQAHLDNARRLGKTSGWAIRCMNDGDPIPVDPNERDLFNQIPADLVGIIQH